MPDQAKVTMYIADLRATRLHPVLGQFIFADAGGDLYQINFLDYAYQKLSW
jgi:hypothetical protein